MFLFWLHQLIPALHNYSLLREVACFLTPKGLRSSFGAKKLNSKAMLEIWENSWSITTPGIYWILLRFLLCIITINDLINGNKNHPIVFSFAPFRQSRITAVLAAKIKAATEKEVQLFDKKTPAQMTWYWSPEQYSGSDHSPGHQLPYMAFSKYQGLLTHHDIFCQTLPGQGFPFVWDRASLHRTTLDSAACGLEF